MVTKKTNTKKNNKKLGDDFEKESMNTLVNAGYTVIRSPRTMRCIGFNRWISQDNDYFGLYDLCAKSGEYKTRWIQCKVLGENSHLTDVKSKIKEFHDKYNGADEISEIWIKHMPSKEVEILRYTTNLQEWNKIK